MQHRTLFGREGPLDLARGRPARKLSAFSCQLSAKARAGPDPPGQLGAMWHSRPGCVCFPQARAPVPHGAGPPFGALNSVRSVSSVVNPVFSFKEYGND